MARHPHPAGRDSVQIGVILAGGLASRLGGGHKGLLRIGGRTILDRVADVLRAGCTTILLNANGDPAALGALGLPVVADTLPDRPGPLAGVLAAMEWAASSQPEATHIVTAPADTPFLPTDLVAKLDATRVEAGATLACARSGGATHPVAALWPVALRNELRHAVADEGLRKVGLFLARYPVAYADWPVEPFDPFFNVNTPSDLAAAEIIAGRLQRRV